MTLATQRRGLFAGTAALEFALAAPILMFLGLAAVDLALTIDARLRLGEAARAGAHHAALAPWSEAGVTEAAARAVDLPVTVSAVRFSGCAGAQGVEPRAACANGEPPGDYARIIVTAQRQPMIRLPLAKPLIEGALTLRATTVTRTR